MELICFSKTKNNTMSFLGVNYNDRSLTVNMVEELFVKTQIF